MLPRRPSARGGRGASGTPPAGEASHAGRRRKRASTPAQGAPARQRTGAARARTATLAHAGVAVTPTVPGDASRRRQHPASAAAQSASNRPAPSAVCPAAIVHRLCVVVVEAIVSSRPRRAVGSVRSTRQSSIACAKSSRMPPPPASVGAGPSGRPPAVVPAATSLAFRPPRTAIRAQRPGTWKRPLNRGLLAVGTQLTQLNTWLGWLPPPVVSVRHLVSRRFGRPLRRAPADP